MTRAAWVLAALCLTVLAGCEPSGDVDPSQKAYHKANRDAYLYQGI